MGQAGVYYMCSHLPCDKKQINLFPKMSNLSFKCADGLIPLCLNCTKVDVEKQHSAAEKTNLSKRII